MTEWFTPEAARWFSLLSLMSLLCAVAPWVTKGQHKILVTGLYAAALGVGFLLLGASIVARTAEQPDHVVRTLTTAGVVLTVIFGVFLGVIRAGYAKAERLKITARDI